jgi:hypothetical protein
MIKKVATENEKSTFHFVTRRHFTSSKIASIPFNVSKLETYIAGKTPARQTVINMMISCK